MVAATVGLGVLASWGAGSHWDQLSATDQARFDPVSQSLAGISLGQLAIAVLGVLVVTTEYSTGGIRGTFTAVPQRLRVLTAKTLVFTVVALVAGLATSFAAFFAGQPFFAKPGIEAHISDPGVLRAIIGGGLFLTASGLFGLAVGTVMRHSAGAITVAVAGLFVVPLFTHALPGAWGDAVVRYFTSNAGQQITATHQTGNYLTPWVGFAVFCAWWAVPLVFGAWLMKQRDA